MTYRDDLEVLQARIEGLEQQIVDLRRERDRLNAARNLGPEAPQWFSKLMYRLGRAIGGRLRSRRPKAADQRAIEAARERLRLLERRAGLLEEEVAFADQIVKEALIDAQRPEDP